MRWTALSCALLFALTISPARADDRLRVLPEPREVSGYAAAGLRLNSGLTIAYRGVSADAAANAQIGRRWAVIGVTVGAPRPAERTGAAQIVVSGLSAANRYLRARLGSEGYVLLADSHGVRIQADGSAGRFYGLMTLCQMPRHDRSGWRLPSVKIVDWPALRWRGLSDDISRGPIPTIEFFEDRIRTLAAFKANLYSPYMEHVFFTAGDPLPAPPDALDAAQLRDLSRYAALFHITLMPEQETLGHMHHALAMQQYAALAEVPNGAVLSPAVPQSAEYAGRLVRAEAAAVTSRTPFFHIGGDEPFELGTGKARELLGRSGPAKLYADYFAPIWADVQAAGMRPVIWGDFLLAHPEAIPLLPKDVVIANWHYGAQRSFERFLQPFARAGLEQFVSPGDSNWGEIYPDISAAVGNTGRYIADGQRTRGVIGVLDTVWNDDGETLFNATWYPVLYGVAAGWQSGFADERRFHDRFAWSFFGTDGDRLTRDIDDLRQANTDLTTTPSDASDYQFWADPFAVSGRIAQQVDIAKVRLDAEDALRDLETSAPPPLHPGALQVMKVAALRFDLLGRQLQIAAAIDREYADALAARPSDEDRVYGDLYDIDGLLADWEEQLNAIRAQYRAAWLLECRPAYLANVTATYDARLSQIVALDSRLLKVIREDYMRGRHSLPASFFSLP